MTDAEALIQKAKTASFHLLKVRPRSEQELRFRLGQKGFSEETINPVIEELKRVKLIDDKVFSRLWVDSRLKRPFGSRRLQFELQLKGVDPELVKKTLEEASSPEKEEETARELAEKKLRLSSNLDKRKARTRIGVYLLRRGFSSEIVHRVINDL